jgi:hypothetical protein
MSKRKEVPHWSKLGRSVAKEFEYVPPMSADVEEQIQTDEARLLEALDSHKEKEELLGCLSRLRSNAQFISFAKGYGTGYKVGKEAGSFSQSVSDWRIIGIITSHPLAGPNEICELIDDHNARAERDSDKIALPYKDLRMDGLRDWTENATVPRVKVFISGLKRKVRRGLYAAQFSELRFVDPAESAKRSK